MLGASQILAHVPDFVFCASKPRREIRNNPRVFDDIAASLRTFEDAAAYLPNHVFIGGEDPKPLTDSDRPWWHPDTKRLVLESRYGALFDQSEFLSAIEAVDTVGLIQLADGHARVRPDSLQARLVEMLGRPRALGEMLDPLPIPAREGSLGKVGWGYWQDDALAPYVVLENLATKATGALALAHLLVSNEIDPSSLDFVLSCSEEAVGDRYQRGGGNLGKAIAESVGAEQASGFDVKNFCAAPVPAMVVAASLVESGVARRIAVVAGGSLPKIGMKFQGHLKSGMPVLEDCLGGFAVLIGDGEGPRIRLDAVGRHRLATGNAVPQVFSELIFEALGEAGLKASDVDLFGTELHNPELTEPQGSGDVPMRNYKSIAALAVKHHHIDREQTPEFLSTRCVAGFAPTQGHIASAVCLLPHVLDRLATGTIRRAQLVSKASLFLGRMTSTSDGMSILVEA